MSLTDDWKAGKLKYDKYYVRLINNDVTTGFFDGISFSCCADFGIAEILAPVPTYDELANLETKLEMLQVQNAELNETTAKAAKIAQDASEENEELRELLKEVKSFLEYAHPIEDISVFEGIENLLTRINAAIGDNEIQSNPVDCNKI